MEAIGGAAGILQIAQLGFALVGSFDKFFTDAKRADRDLQAVADDVRHLATVLQRAHGEIKAGVRANLYTPDAVKDFKDVLDGTTKAFQQVKELLDNLVPGQHRSVQFKVRLRWAFNKKDGMNLLRSDLERLKTSLLLMLGVFNLGLSRRMASSKNSDAFAEIQSQRQDIERLAAENLRAKQKHDALEKSLAAQTPSDRTPAHYSPGTRAVGPQQIYNPWAFQNGKDDYNATSNLRAAPFTALNTSLTSRDPSYRKPVQQSPAPTTIPPAQTPLTSTGSLDEEDKHDVGSSLQACASAASELVASIDAAISRWNSRQSVDTSEIRRYLDTVCSVAFTLPAFASPRSSPEASFCSMPLAEVNCFVSPDDEHQYQIDSEQGSICYRPYSQPASKPTSEFEVAAASNELQSVDTSEILGYSDTFSSMASTLPALASPRSSPEASFGFMPLAESPALIGYDSQSSGNSPYCGSWAYPPAPQLGNDYPRQRCRSSSHRYYRPASNPTSNLEVAGASNGLSLSSQQSGRNCSSGTIATRRHLPRSRKRPESVVYHCTDECRTDLTTNDVVDHLLAKWIAAAPAGNQEEE